MLGKRSAALEWENEAAAKRPKLTDAVEEGDNPYGDLEALPVTFENVLAAAKRIEGGVVMTSSKRSRALSKELDMNLYFKNDFQQFTGSFKERGALNALLRLSTAKRTRGVIAASAGNHALALAYHGSRLKCPVTVVMPLTAPLNKIKQCREFGADVIVRGDNFSEAVAHARALCEERGLTYVHGFNDPHVIAGQGSVGLEMMAQIPGLDAVIVPVGGGGLIAGIAIALKTQMPHVELIGVESNTFPCMTESLLAGHAVEVPGRASIADGLAVRLPGDNNVEICKALVDRVITVSEHHIALAILRLMEAEKCVVEGAGASGLAPLLAGELPELRGKTVGVVLCGGNIDVTLLGRVLDHGLAAGGRLARFQSMISDRPGGLAHYTKVIAATGASVKDLTHERSFTGDSFSSVHVTCIIETRDREHLEQVLSALIAEGVPTIERGFARSLPYDMQESDIPAAAAKVNEVAASVAKVV